VFPVRYELGFEIIFAVISLSVRIHVQISISNFLFCPCEERWLYALLQSHPVWNLANVHKLMVSKIARRSLSSEPTRSICCQYYEGAP
jgi:hypothetical protein